MNFQRTGVVLLLILFVEYLTAVFNLPFLNHLGTLSLIIFGLFIDSGKQRWHSVAIIYVYLIAIQSLAKNDIQSLLFATSNLLCTIAYSKISPLVSSSLQKIFKVYLFCIVLPITFLLFVVPINLKIPEAFGEINYTFPARFIPSLANEYSINIGPSNFTKHFTGDIGLICFFSSFLFSKTERKNIVFILFSLYLIIFSGSRTAICSFLATISVFYINRKVVRPNTTFLFLLAFVLCFYFVEDIIDLLRFGQYNWNSDLVVSKLKVENDSGVTAGRSFLWDYHLDLFFNNPILGVRSELVSFGIGDLLRNGQIAVAGSESFYTNCLARFGILGIIFPLLHVKFLVEAFRTRCIEKIIFCTLFLLGNVFNSAFQNVYGALSPFMYLLIFSNHTYLRLGRVELKAKLLQPFSKSVVLKG